MKALKYLLLFLLVIVVFGVLFVETLPEAYKIDNHTKVFAALPLTKKISLDAVQQHLPSHLLDSVSSKEFQFKVFDSNAAGTFTYPVRLRFSEVNLNQTQIDYQIEGQRNYKQKLWQLLRETNFELRLDSLMQQSLSEAKASAEAAYDYYEFNVIGIEQIPASFIIYSEQNSNLSEFFDKLTNTNKLLKNTAEAEMIYFTSKSPEAYFESLNIEPHEFIFSAVMQVKDTLKNEYEHLRQTYFKAQNRLVAQYRGRPEFLKNAIEDFKQFVNKAPVTRLDESGFVQIVHWNENYIYPKNVLVKLSIPVQESSLEGFE